MAHAGRAAEAAAAIRSGTGRPAMSSSASLLSIIVPVFNEARTVKAVLERLRTIALPIAREIIVVDDGSSDGTREALEPFEGAPDVLVIYAKRNGGKGSAIRLGIARARGTIIAIQDADLELDPSQLGSLVQPILDGDTDVVFGSRFLAGAAEAPWRTRAANRLLTAVTNLLYGSSLTDMETCYKVMRTEVATSLGLESERFDIEPEIAAKLLRRDHTILEVPVSFRARGRSAGKKIGWRDGLAALGALVRYRFTPRGS